jgi:hypothetical protein
VKYESHVVRNNAPPHTNPRAIPNATGLNVFIVMKNSYSSPKY